VTLHLSHKIRIYPNNIQETYFNKACGCRRLAYNWTLENIKKLYEADEKPSKYGMCSLFNSIKQEQFPFVMEVTKWATQKAHYDAWDAYKRWWKKTSKHPRYKKRGKSRESFYLGVETFKVEKKRLKIPKLSSKIKMAQEIRFPGRLLSLTIGKDSNKWYASFLVEVLATYKYPHTCENQEVCGIDLGIKSLLIVSDGTVYENPKHLRRKKVNLRALNKSLSRKQKGSKNREKAKILLSRQHEKIKHSRRNFQHKCTTSLVRENKYIGIEDLNVSGMLKNHCLAKSIADAGWSEIRRQLEYKAKLSGSVIVLADRFFPSSKLCSVCSVKNKDLVLKDRTWTCSACNTTHDRDLNAAYNLESLARRYRDCGEDVSLETLCSQQPRRSKKRASTFVC